MSSSPLTGSRTDLPGLEALVDFLQDDAEERSRALARELHDDLGGNLIAATMDVAWLTRHAAAGDEVSRRLNRIEASLTKTIESVRRLVDELQPALIDSVGLFVAVSAHFGRECRRYGMKYGETMVGVAPELDPASAMTVFRVAQGFLQWIREDAGASELYARFQGDQEWLTMRFVAQGVKVGLLTDRDAAAPRLAAIAMRLRRLNGTLRSEATNSSVAIQVQIPADASHPQIAA